mgnify:CR=1 FL=1
MFQVFRLPQLIKILSPIVALSLNVISIDEIFVPANAQSPIDLTLPKNLIDLTVSLDTKKLEILSI